MGLLDKDDFKVEGNIVLNAKKRRSLLKQSATAWKKVRGEQISLIFQNPTLALHPYFKIGTQMVDVLRSKKKKTKQEAMDEIYRQLSFIGFSDPIKIATSYPSQLSGGMNQLIQICLSILLRPPLLIADEPTTSLDTISQKEIINKLLEVKKTYNMSILFVTHDLRIVNQIADKVAVMKDGELIETAPLFTIKETPQHPYTRKLWNQLLHF